MEKSAEKIAKTSDYILTFSTNKKFSLDKFLYDGDKYLVAFDGVILNLDELISFGADNLEVVVNLFKDNPISFVNQIKGSFAGVVFEKKSKKWHFFSDHINTKPWFFFQTMTSFIFTTSIDSLVTYFNDNSIEYSLSTKGAYCLLTYGFMLGDTTLIAGVKRIRYGNIVSIDKNFALCENSFYKLDNKHLDSLTQDDAIDEFDRLFRIAITRAFEKDKQYGYNHVATLSGGLDSRMTVIVAHDLGYTKQLNLTFSQSDYLDEKIPKQISADLHHDWLFKSLDNGEFLKDLMDVIPFTNGVVLYYGLAHQDSLYKYIDFSNLGLIHSGQLGDVVLSSFSLTGQNNKYVERGLGGYDLFLVDRLKEFSFIDDYLNEELFLFESRCFNGANAGLNIAMNYSETYSPFYDVDVLNFALKIPFKFRENHKLYKLWMNKKYPHSADYIWEKTGRKIDAKVVNIKGKEIPIASVIPKVLDMVKHKFGVPRRSGGSTKHHMNPLNYWYNRNISLKKFMDDFYSENIDLVDDERLKIDCMRLYKTKSAIAKNQVLSLIAAIKYYQIGFKNKKNDIK